MNKKVTLLIALIFQSLVLTADRDREAHPYYNRNECMIEFINIRSEDGRVRITLHEKIQEIEPSRVILYEETCEKRTHLSTIVKIATGELGLSGGKELLEAK